MVTKGLDKCLYIYSIAEWEKQMDKIAVLPESDPKVRAYIRHSCANAAECEFDKQGRIVIPAELERICGHRQRAGYHGSHAEDRGLEQRKSGMRRTTRTEWIPTNLPTRWHSIIFRGSYGIQPYFGTP